MGYALSTFLPPPTKFQAHFVNGGSAAPASVARRHLDALSSAPSALAVLDHRFVPALLTVPAAKYFLITKVVAMFIDVPSSAAS